MYLETLKKQILVMDGAMGTMVQDLFLPDSAFGGEIYKMLTDLIIFSRPEELKEVHKKYLRVGANIIETNTFGASGLRLQEYDFKEIDLSDFKEMPKDFNIKTQSYDEIAYHMSYHGARLAKEAIAEYKLEKDYDGRPLFVAGSIGPSNFMLSPTEANLNMGQFDQIVDNFYHQSLGLVKGGADLLLFETQQDQLELKAAVMGGRKAIDEVGSNTAIQVQVTVDQFCKMQIFNTDVHAAYTTNAGVGIDIFGINCTTGPDEMERTVKRMAEFSEYPISVIPNAGQPVSEDGKTVYKLDPEIMADFAYKFVTEYGINIVGGCCGTTPAHIGAIAKRIKGMTPVPRTVQKRSFISGPQEAVEFKDDQGAIRIGERLNVRGSKKVRDAVENDGEMDIDALNEVVEEQAKDLGLSILDVCMDSNLVNTEEVLPKVIINTTKDYQGALCLDSFSVEALEEAIKVYSGRPIINSISLEEYEKGVDKVDAVLDVTQHHHPIYIALVNGNEGPGITADEKYNLAKAIVDKCQARGVTADQLIIDVNAYPIGSESDENMNFTLETFKAIPRIKAIHPDLKTSIGVGNLTNGLAKKPYMRILLTSVFLYEANKVGLDAAIVNSNHYVPIESLDKNDVALAMKVLYERDMDAYAALEEIALEKKGIKKEKRTNYDDLALEEKITQKIIDGYKDKEIGSIEVEGHTYGYKDKLVFDVVEAIKTHEPLNFINIYLMGAMKELGDGFGKGEVSLPHLLKSADVMKQAMGFLEQYMKNKTGTKLTDEIQYKGTVVIGTVYQDVHSIGKDLAKTLLENYGFRVIDLGVQVELERFIEVAKAEKADAIGMSALLVQTSNHMITVSKMLQENNMHDTSILIGGAPVSTRHAAYVSMYGQENPEKLNPKVFFCNSGMDGVNYMQELMDKTQSLDLIEKNGVKLKKAYQQAIDSSKKSKEKLASLPMRVIDLSDHNLDQNQYGIFSVEIDIKELEKDFDLATLFALNWRFGSKKSWEAKGVSEESLMKLKSEWVQNCSSNNWIKPKASYGLFPVQSDGSDLIVYDPYDKTKILGTFDFNLKAAKEDKWYVSQYFHSKDSGKYDVLGVQLSSAGTEPQTQITNFKKQDENDSSFYLQGLADRVAEDMAEYTHKILREKMRVEPKVGARFSPGYPAMSNIENNKLIHKILNGAQLDVELTDGFEFNPISATGAIACFHDGISYS